MSAVKYLFDPPVIGAFFSVSPDGSKFSADGERIKRGDMVSLTDEMAANVRDIYGADCLRPPSSVVLDGKAGVVSADSVVALELRCEFWRLSALALAAHHNRRGEMARVLGAAKNADADAQKALLVSPPDAHDMRRVVDAMRAVEQGWA